MSAEPIDNTAKWGRLLHPVMIDADYDIGGRPTQTRMEGECCGCGAIVTVYVWSFRGGGKRCPHCNLMLSSWGPDQPELRRTQ